MFCFFFQDVHDFIDKYKSHGLTYGDVYVGTPALADDIMLLSSTKSGLDAMMSRALLYSQLWRITFNPNKCKCMVFGESKVTNVKNKSNRIFFT